jgi:hypothetical protein
MLLRGFKKPTPDTATGNGGDMGPFAAWQRKKNGAMRAHVRKVCTVVQVQGGGEEGMAEERTGSPGEPRGPNT